MISRALAFAGPCCAVVMAEMIETIGFQSFTQNTALGPALLGFNSYRLRVNKLELELELV